MHEASLHQDNAFVTLTYDDEHLPAGGSLDPSAFPLFMRRLRKVVRDVRYFYCGEYGEEGWRPHYHALLFGWWPEDAVPCGVRGDHQVYRSAALGALWRAGFSEVGSVTFDSAAYVARYVTKKVRGAAASAHYLSVDRETGEVFPVVREFAQMSRRPGIGRDWYGRFGPECEADGMIPFEGKLVPMPRYYRKLCEKQNPEAAAYLGRLAMRRQRSLEVRGLQSVAQFEKNELYQLASHNLTRGME